VVRSCFLCEADDAELEGDSKHGCFGIDSGLSDLERRCPSIGRERSLETSVKLLFLGSAAGFGTDEGLADIANGEEVRG